MKPTTFAFSILATVFVGCGTQSKSQQETSQTADISPVTCSIQTITGHYLTAVGGGGRISDVIHTDATRVGAWEKFRLIDAREGTPLVTYGLKTVNGRYLTAVSGGGRIHDVVHTDATQLLGWEKFVLVPLGGGQYAIQTSTGHYLTANYGGGQVADAIHSDATKIGAWEKFRFNCGL